MCTALSTRHLLVKIEERLGMESSLRRPYRIRTRGMEHVATRLEVKARSEDHNSDLHKLIHGVKLSRQSSLNQSDVTDDDWITVNLRVLRDTSYQRSSHRSPRYGKSIIKIRSSRYGK